MNALHAEKVVVPVDFSEPSIQAIETALHLVDDPANVHVLHVLMPLDSVSPGSLWGDLSDEKRQQATRQYFEKFLSDHNLPAVTTHVAIGNPGLQIADYAEDIAADLIVISSHGYHGVKRLVLGSVAERALRHAPCSVLVLRRDDGE